MRGGMNVTVELKILKAILLLRNFNRYSSKEEQIAEQMKSYKAGYITEPEIDQWIESLKEEIAKTPEQREKESREYIEWLMEQELEDLKREDYYTPSATAGDYSPSCPWKAPGCSISDFI
jgi:hypothetical protein